MKVSISGELSLVSLRTKGLLYRRSMYLSCSCCSNLFLERSHATVSFKTEHIDDLIYIKTSGSSILRRGGFKSRLLVIKDLGVVQPVLCRIKFVIVVPHFYIGQVKGSHMDHYIKTLCIRNGIYRIFHGRLANHGKPNRIFEGNPNAIPSHGVCDHPFAGGTHHSYCFQRSSGRNIVHRTADIDGLCYRTMPQQSAKQEYTNKNLV